MIDPKDIQMRAEALANQIACPILRSMYSNSRTQVYKDIKDTYLKGVNESRDFYMPIIEALRAEIRLSKAVIASLENEVLLARKVLLPAEDVVTDPQVQMLAAHNKSLDNRIEQFWEYMGALEANDEKELGKKKGRGLMIKSSHLSLRFYKKDGWTKELLEVYLTKGSVKDQMPNREVWDYYFIDGSLDMEKLFNEIEPLVYDFKNKLAENPLEYLKEMN